MSNGKMTRQEKSLLYGLYSILGSIVHVLLASLAPLLDRVRPEWQLRQRLGGFGGIREKHNRLIWIHAASVGEVQAARVLITALRDTHASWQFFLTTTTAQGKAVADASLPEDVCCRMAPLDTPIAVDRALRAVQPDLYICLETELWPVMLFRVCRAGIPMLLLNGRMSERSCRHYLLVRGTMAAMLSGFAALAVISERDAACYRKLGADHRRIKVCGNMKYAPLSHEEQEGRQQYRHMLRPAGKKVFICGSTRTGEEQLLLPVFKRLQSELDHGVIWVLAPRHLERLAEVEAVLERAGLSFDLLSRCRTEIRTENIVVVDTLGDLADLYGACDYIFCGGSLINKGGHNIMEPILRQRPVYFGPYMQDFQDAVDLVLAAGAGFQVANNEELAALLCCHCQTPVLHTKAEHAAAGLAAVQLCTVQCQTAMVEQLIVANRNDD